MAEAAVVVAYVWSHFNFSSAAASPSARVTCRSSYTGSEIAAQEANRVAREVLGQHGIQAEFAPHHWHPIEEEWESPFVAVPQTEAEHLRLEDAETAESHATGIAQWEARAELPSHLETVALASQLRSERRAVVERWKGSSWSSAPVTRTTP